MADRYLLESGAPDGYLLEDGSGVLLLEGSAASLELGQATETDSAQALTALAGARAVAIGQATETDSAQAITIARAVAIGQAIETDTAQPLVASGTAGAVGPPSLLRVSRVTPEPRRVLVVREIRSAIANYESRSAKAQPQEQDMPIATYTHDPNAILDYTIDWSAWLPSNDTISTATWTVPAPLTEVSDTIVDGRTTVWISGGVAGTSYDVSVRIVTAAGRQDDRTISLSVAER